MIKVRSGLKFFMNHIIDYAGMFPPAKLDFETAFSNYLAYQNHPDNWMIERFVFPITNYSALPSFSQQLSTHSHTVKLSTLPQYQASADLFLSNFMTDLVQMGKVVRSLSDKIDFRYFEFKLPADLVDAEQNVFNDFFTQLIQFAKDHPLTNPRFFVEIPMDADWKFKFNRITSLLTHHPLSRNLGFKLRCGGVTPDAFPEVEVLATAILLCQQKKLPMKFTAGLHHPIRHYNESVQTKMYGFFNLFGACILANTHQLSAQEIEEILIDEKKDHFTFADQGMKWRTQIVTTKQIAEAREHFCLSYGSCSFDEPREDLRTLHLI